MSLQKTLPSEHTHANHAGDQQHKETRDTTVNKHLTVKQELQNEMSAADPATIVYRKLGRTSKQDYSLCKMHCNDAARGVTAMMVDAFKLLR